MNAIQQTKRRTFEILESAAEGDRPSRTFDIFIVVLIILNVLAVIFETVHGLAVRFGVFFSMFEMFSVAIFTVEYVSRLWACTEDDRFRGVFVGRVRFAFTLLAVIDLLAILPFYLPMFIPIDLRFLRALRLVRIFRMFKLTRYSESMRLLGRVIRNAREELFITVFVGGILLVLAASLMYFAERGAQPEVFSSIPAALWWGVATLTTVGYGDIFPVTVLGKILAAVMAILSIGIFALPTGIISSEFVREFTKRRKERIRCPHCGNRME